MMTMMTMMMTVVMMMTTTARVLFTPLLWHRSHTMQPSAGSHSRHTAVSWLNKPPHGFFPLLDRAHMIAAGLKESFRFATDQMGKWLARLPMPGAPSTHSPTLTALSPLCSIDRDVPFAALSLPFPCIREAPPSLFLRAPCHRC